MGGERGVVMRVFFVGVLRWDSLVIISYFRALVSGFPLH